MTTIDRRPTLFAAYGHAAEIVTGVDSGQLEQPTPCPDYNVATLVDHIVGAGHRAVALGLGEAPSGDEFPRIELIEAPAQLRQAGKEAEAAWADDSSLSRTVTMPWGETYTGATLVDMYLVELTTHAWDLAKAAGLLDTLDGDLAPTALEAARSMLRPEYRNMMGEGAPFGSEVDAPTDATPWESLAAFMGRQPR